VLPMFIAEDAPWTPNFNLPEPSVKPKRKTAVQVPTLLNFLWP
jgi:hypothetical protein